MDEREQPKIKPSEKLTEERAEEILEGLLNDDRYSFLNLNPRSAEMIGNAETSVEALSVARGLILKRLEKAIIFDASSVDDRFENVKANAETILRTMESINENAQLIGEGQDAIVVIDKNEIREFPPEVCYKFSKREKTPRGRNSIGVESAIQQDFYDVLSATETQIGIPQPFYAIDTGSEKMFAMEKLAAVSVDEINRGIKTLPEWLDIDELCDELEAVVELLHHNGLYHRDLHPGNVMISIEKPVNPSQKRAYIIDFGLSGKGDDIEPYRRETAEGVFTYDDDCAMIKSVRQILKKVHQLNKEGYADA